MMRFVRLSFIVRLILIALLFASGVSAKGLHQSLFKSEQFSNHDAVLVINSQGKTLFSWQANAQLIPASTIKIITALMALEKWGLAHRFYTNFYIVDKVLWVKGYADPFLISEELDLLVNRLIDAGLQQHNIESIVIDNSFIRSQPVPGRSEVVDPYNAPLSAVSANFNTAKISKTDNTIRSAEPQTPLTQTARRLAKKLTKQTDRINLLTAQNAQQHFAELMALKLAEKQITIQNIKIDRLLPTDAKLFYQHSNSHDLQDVLNGMLVYSNNFIANQLFLLLGAQQKDGKLLTTDFDRARQSANTWLKNRFNFQPMMIDDGAGLSRANRLSAAQLQTVLAAFQPYRKILKHYRVGNWDSYAKTGTLDGIRSFAGYLETEDGVVTFVFFFNQTKPYGYRDQLLKQLVHTLNKDINR